MKPSPTRSRNSWRILLALVLFAVAGWLLWRANQADPVAEIPQVDLKEAHPAVAKTIRAATQEVEKRPRSATAWSKLGMILHAHEYAAEAIVCYGQAAELSPQEYRWPYLQGGLLEAIDKQQAEAAYQESLKREPEIFAPYLRLAEMRLDRGDLEEGERYLQEALQRRPNSVRAMFQMARLRLRQQKLQESWEWSEKAAAGNINVRLIREFQAQLQNRMGDAEKAEELLASLPSLPAPAPWPDPFLKKVKSMRVDPNWLSFQAKEMIRRGETAAGVQTLKQLVKHYPERWEFREQLAAFYLQINAAAPARRLLDEGLQLHPNSFSMHRLRGALHLMEAEWPEGEEHLRTALKIKNDSPLEHYDLGHCLLEQNRDKEALEEFRTVLKFAPNMIDAHIAIARLHQKKERIEEAKKALEAVFKIAPDHPTAKEILSELDK